MSQATSTEVANTKDRQGGKQSERKVSSTLARKMSNQLERVQNLREVRMMVERRQAEEFADKRGLPKVPKVSKGSTSDQFVYVNSGYTGGGSADSVRVHIDRLQAPTSVVREQYWACSRWPLAQRALAVAVGVLLGTVIGLAATVAVRGGDVDIAQIFRHATPS